MYKEYLQKLENLKGKELKGTELKSKRIELGIDNLEKELNNLKKIREQSYKVGSKFMDLIDDLRETFSDTAVELHKIKKSAKDLGIDFKTLPINKEYEYEKKKITPLLKNNIKLS